MEAFKSGPGNTVTLSQNKHRRHSTSRSRMQAMKEAEAEIRDCKSRNAKNFQAIPRSQEKAARHLPTGFRGGITLLIPQIFF